MFLQHSVDIHSTVVTYFSLHQSGEMTNKLTVNQAINQPTLSSSERPRCKETAITVSLAREANCGLS